MKPTKIEKVETILWDRWLLVRIYCEDGTVGIGVKRESTDGSDRPRRWSTYASRICLARTPP